MGLGRYQTKAVKISDNIRVSLCAIKFPRKWVYDKPHEPKILALICNVCRVCKIWVWDDIKRKLLKFQIIKESLCVLSNFEAS